MRKPATTPKNTRKKLTLTKETVKDLALRGKRAQVVKGGGYSTKVGA